MKISLQFISLFVLVLTVFEHSADAQRRRRYGNNEEIDGWSVGIKTGLTQSFGELSTSVYHGIYGIDVNKGISPSVTLKLSTETGNLEGSLKTYYNARFKTDFFMVNLIAVYNVSQLIDDDFPVNIGVYGGFGTMRYNSVAYDLTTGEVMRFSSAFGSGSAHTPIFARYGNARGSSDIYYSIERSVPVGITLSMPIGNAINAGLDLRYNYIRNDKIDATSGLDRSDIRNTSVPYRFWGQLSYSDTPNDRWGYAAFYLTYKFGSSMRSYQRGI